MYTRKKVGRMFVYWHKTQFLCTVCSYSKLMPTLMQNCNTYPGLDNNFNDNGGFLATFKTCSEHDTLNLFQQTKSGCEKKNIGKG